LILTEWSIDVPKEMLDDLFRFAREKLKPFYESHGCKKYALFVPIEKRYFSYQVEVKKTRTTEQMIFEDLEDFEDFLENVREDPHGEEITGSYGKTFQASSVTFRVLTQKV